jgi:Transposase DDE domain
MSSSVASIAQWQGQVATLLPTLTKPEANVLGLLSYAMLLTRGSGLTRLSNWLAQVEQVPVGRLRQRLREFYYEAKAKRGKKRREIQVETCFPDLLGGLLKSWHGPKELVLALDASALGERFVTLNLSVVYRGCGIPVAWKILRANEAEGWKAHWQHLLQVVAEVIPADWRVLVMADRGLYAPWLYRAIQANGWHPFLRVKEKLTFRAQGELAFRPIRERLARRGRKWKGVGDWSETGETIEGTLLVGWEKGYEERMAVVTDLSVEEANVAWYQMRFWIEDEYKDHKRGAFHWEHTKMTDPRRAERLYLVMAVAMQAAVLVGGALEAREQQPNKQRARGGKPVVSRHVGRPAKALHKPRGREQSCLERGCQAISAAAVRAEAVPVGWIVTEPWPEQLSAVGRPASSWVRKRKHKEATRRQRKSKRAEERRRAKAEQNAQKRAEQARQREARQERKAARGAEQRRQREQRHQARQERAKTQEDKRVQREQEAAERQREQEDTRERRLLARREREQERERRARWHEEIRQEREQRKIRQQERAACSRAASRIFPPQEALAPPPQPP